MDTQVVLQCQHSIFRGGELDLFYSSPTGTLPFWLGFLRPETGFFSRPYETDELHENLYRHPAQWGSPTTSFNKLHDIYSLGVVLLEIGLWKPVVEMHRYGFQTLELGSNVSAYMLEAASHQKKRVAMGTKYQRIVISYLNGSLDAPDVSESEVRP
jgi:hypothetical protein